MLRKRKQKVLTQNAQHLPGLLGGRYLLASSVPENYFEVRVVLSVERQLVLRGVSFVSKFVQRALFS